eukprot:364682-Chlamydomonas_euryale.AAC.3
MNLLHKMRLLEEHGKMFGKTELGAMHTMGSDGAFMQCGDGKMSLLDFISRGFLASQWCEACLSTVLLPDCSYAHLH